MAKRYGMVIDLARCVGCWTCAVACKLENDEPPGIWWNRILTVGGSNMDTPSGTYPNLQMSFLPIACQHCENPPCVDVCPVGATYKREDGIVLINWQTCIGCRYCMIACPYGVRLYNWRDTAEHKVPDFQVGAAEVPVRPLGVGEKCTFCVHRVDKGLDPACVASCPAQARFFGDLNDPNSKVSQLIKQKGGYQLQPELGTNPSVYYLPAKR